MEYVPLHNIQLPPDSGGNVTTIPSGNEELHSPSLDSSPVRQHHYEPGTFLPLTADEAAMLPELNFKPLAFKVWYLGLILLWFAACCSGLGVLVYLSRTEPTLLHLRLQYSYALWLYTPGIVGFLTTVLWRGTFQSYIRIVPYSHMAKPIVAGGDQNRGAFLNEPLNSIPGSVVNLDVIFSLYRSGDYLSCAVTISPILAGLLTQIKSGIIQLVEDGAGWSVRIPIGFAIAAMIIYLWLFLVTLGIILFFWRNKTGLKWDPAMLASQLSLIQGSNIFDEIADTSTERFWHLRNAVESWPQRGLRLHLGYWKQQESDLIIHGVRFLQEDETGTLLLAGKRRILQPSPTLTSHDPVWPIDIAGGTRATSNNIIPEVRSDSGGTYRDLDLEHGTRNSDTSARQNDGSTTQANNGLAVQQNLASTLKSRPHVDRVWNVYLMDTYLVAVTILGTSALIVATVAWAKGSLRSSFPFAPDVLRSEHDKAQHSSGSGDRDPRSVIRVFVRAIVFSFLPTLLFTLFHPSFIVADVYQRTMAPVVNMAGPLEKEDLDRFYPGEADIKGAMAKDSMLLDYISPNLISCAASALSSGNYKIVLGLLLATSCNSVYIVVGQLFAFVETPSPGGGVHYVVTIQQRNFLAAFAIMIVYIISLWILRPHGVVRTCRGLYTLMDLASLIPQSHVVQCPEFWLQSPSDTEDHLRAQVIMTNRVYRYGVYSGYDENEYVGIAPHFTPSVWKDAASDVGTPAAISSLDNSVGLARDMLRYGLYGDAMLKSTWDFLQRGPRTAAQCIRVRSNKYRSWRNVFRGRGLQDDDSTHEDEASTTSSYQPLTENGRSGLHQRASLIETHAMGAETSGRDGDDINDGTTRCRSP